MEPIQLIGNCIISSELNYDSWRDLINLKYNTDFYCFVKCVLFNSKFIDSNFDPDYDEAAKYMNRYLEFDTNAIMLRRNFNGRKYYRCKQAFKNEPDECKKMAYIVMCYNVKGANGPFPDFSFTSVMEQKSA